MPDDALTAALRLWTQQGPALLRTALSAKDAEIARLRAECDAQQAELVSLRASVRSLRAAVDQLAALCTAQVAELSRRGRDREHHALYAPTPDASDQARPASPSSPRMLPCADDQNASPITQRLPPESSVSSPPDRPRSLHRQPCARRHIEPPASPELPPSCASSFEGERELCLADDDRVEAQAERASAAEAQRLATNRQLREDVPELPADIEHFVMDEGGHMRLPILARPGSRYVDVTDAGQCVIRDAAFYVRGAELPCDMTVTLEPEELDSGIATFIQFEYPDSTMLPFMPVTGLRVKGAHATYQGGRGAQGMRGPLRADSYGRDYVRLQMPTKMFRTLVVRARWLIGELYPDAVLEEQHVPFENAELVEFCAQLVSQHPVMRGERWDASIAELLMESECDIVGDGTIVMRFLERHGSTELDFVLHRMQLGDEQGNVRSVV